METNETFNLCCIVERREVAQDQAEVYNCAPIDRWDARAMFEKIQAEILILLMMIPLYFNLTTDEQVHPSLC